MFRVLLCLALCGLAQTARAVDNSKHVVGAGVVTNFSGGLSAVGRPVQLSAKFAFQPRAEVSALLGMRLASTTVISPGVKLAWVLIPEKHMNLYAAVSTSLDIRTDGGLSAFLWQVGPGVEVFWPDWPNLGFSLEFGVGGEVLAGRRVVGESVPFSTTGTGFGGAGVHYYF